MMTEEEWRRFERQRLSPWLWVSAEQAKLRDLLAHHQDDICAICGGKMNDGTYIGQSTLDHVIAKSRGGADRLGNLVAAHRGCNIRKSDSPPTGCTLIFLLAVNARLGVEPMRW